MKQTTIEEKKEIQAFKNKPFLLLESFFPEFMTTSSEIFDDQSAYLNKQQLFVCQGKFIVTLLQIGVQIISLKRFFLLDCKTDIH